MISSDDKRFIFNNPEPAAVSAVGRNMMDLMHGIYHDPVTGNTTGTTSASGSGPAVNAGPVWQQPGSWERFDNDAVDNSLGNGDYMTQSRVEARSKVNANTSKYNFIRSDVSLDKLEKHMNKLGFTESEIAGVKNSWNADNARRITGDELVKQSKSIQSNQAKFNALDAQIQQNNAAIEQGVDSAKLIESNKSLQKQKTDIGDKINDIRNGSINDTRKGYLEKNSLRNDAYGSLDKIIAAGGDASAGRMDSLKGALNGERNAARFGRMGRFAVGAMVGLGIINLVNGDKGKMDNSQLYNPGGPI